MHLLSNKDLNGILTNQYVLLDGDFLGKLYEDEEFLGEFVSLLSKSSLMLDPMVAFEFLRDVFDPEYRKQKEKFLDDEIFNKTNNHQNVFLKIQENALLLSKIYAHKNKSKGVSTSDLYLASRIFQLPSNSVLITGNKKHFPSCVFSVVGVINVEDQKDESIRSFSILKLDKNNLEKSYSDLLKMENKKR